MATVSYDANGNPVVNLSEIRRVTIENVVDVISHRIMRDNDKTVHEIEFAENGKCRFAYTVPGKLVEFTIHHMSMLATEDNDVILRKFDRTQLP